jgi:hypothetical protein
MASVILFNHKWSRVANSKLLALPTTENDQVWSSQKQELLLQLSTWRTKPLVVTSIKKTRRIKSSMLDHSRRILCSICTCWLIEEASLQMCRKCWKKLKDIILQDSNVACNSRTNHSMSNCIEQCFEQKWESWYTLARYLLLKFLAWLWFRKRTRRLVLVFRKLWLCFTVCTLKGKST